MPHALLTIVPGADPEGSLLPGLLMAGGVLLAVMVMLRHWKRTARTKSELDRDPRERLEEMHERARAQRDAYDGASADAEDLTRRLAATLDTKAARLELLIERAEAAIDRLEAARAAPPALDPAEVRHLADLGHSPAQIAEQLGHPVGQVELVLNLRRRSG